MATPGRRTAVTLLLGAIFGFGFALIVFRASGGGRATPGEAVATRESQPGEEGPRRDPAPTRAHAQRALLDLAMLSAVREIVREELAAALAKAPATKAEVRPEAEPPDAPPPLSAEQVAKMGSARVIVEGAIARGRWTFIDREKVREALAGMPGDVEEGIFTPLILAFNQDKVKNLVVGDSPF